MRYSFLFLVCLAFPVSAWAHGHHENTETDIQGVDQTLSAFARMLPVETSVTIPTVVDVPVTDTVFRIRDAVVYEETTKRFQPYVFHSKQTFSRAVATIVTGAEPSMGVVGALTDGNGDTTVEFPVDENQISILELKVDFSRPTVVSGFLFSLDRYVALPQSVSVSVPSTDGLGAPRTILAQSSLTGTTVRFPELTASSLIIKLWFGQPLRIREMDFFEEDVRSVNEGSVRFLARPGERYTLYAYSDRGYIAPVGEIGNLRDDTDVKRLSGGELVANPLYRPADSDGDGIIDRTDNCVRIENPDQHDENGNGRGDKCDDYDRDGIVNSQDNCPAHPNRIQTDTDRDGKGDTCDGEESRITEKYVWMPWVALGLGIVVDGGLFISVFRRTRSLK